MDNQRGLKGPSQSDPGATEMEKPDIELIIMLRIQQAEEGKPVGTEEK